MFQEGLILMTPFSVYIWRSDTIIDIHVAFLGSAPPSPPQVVRPALLTRTLFNKDKLHNSLVINNQSQTKQCIKQTRDSSSATLVAAINKKAAQPLAQSHSCTPSLPMPNSGPSTLVSGSKEKKRILDKYVSKLVLTIKNKSSPRKKVSLTIMNLCSLLHPLGNARSLSPTSTTQ
jgi:hypothetical protein